MVRIAAAVLWVVIGMCPVAHAGPVFHLMGTGGIAPLHPDGDGAADRMVVSDNFAGITTGGGFMDGRVTFVDGFVLPSAGGVVAFDESDIAEVRFEHAQNVLTPPGPVFPLFGFTATGADLVSASGTIVNVGGELVFGISGAGPAFFETSINFTAPTAFGSPVSGNLEILGSVVRVNGNFVSNGVPTSPFIGNLIPSSQADGNWQMTGITSVSSEPSIAALFFAGLVVCGWCRRRSADGAGTRHGEVL